MEVKNLPSDTFRKLANISGVYFSSDNCMAVYNTDKLSQELIAFGFMDLDKTKEIKSFDNYKFYIVNEKFANMKHAAILEEITGKSISQIMAEKVISITDVPWDYEDLFEALDECDGYFDKIDIENKNFRNILDFHGFIYGVGANGNYSAGTPKLSKYIKNNIEYKVIEIITGKTKEENDKILENDVKTQEIKQMKEIANKYGFNVLTDEELELAYKYQG